MTRLMTTRPPGIVVLKYNSLIVGQIKDWTIRDDDGDTYEIQTNPQRSAFR